MTRYDSVLVTGGAGFIGTAVVRRLLGLAARITIIDSLHPQVHGSDPPLPEPLANVHLVRADVRDISAVRQTVTAVDPDLIIHLAAETGTGQSYDEASRYCDVNIMGTAILAEALRAVSSRHARRRLVLASSRAVYGEGAYVRHSGELVFPGPRTVKDMIEGKFVPQPEDDLCPVATPEWAPARPASVYASTKLMQEYLLSQTLTDSPIEVVTLRLQNVFGSGQSLSNPYTGVLSIFSKQALSGSELDIYEDGDIVRDFVHVSDVASAILAAAAATEVPVSPVNIGSGVASTMAVVAQRLLTHLGASPDAFRISGNFRPGDVRHAVADIKLARSALAWTPLIDLDSGLREFSKWARDTLVQTNERDG